MKNESPQVLHDALQACLRAVLAWHEQPLSSASMRSRLGGHPMWSQDTLIEAADSLGYDVAPGRIDPALPCLPPLPAICYTHEGTAIVVLAYESENQVLVVDPERSEKPEPAKLSDVFARLSGNTLSLSRRGLGSVAGDPATKAPTSRHGHWFWGPIIRLRWVYLQVALAALLVNLFALASSVFSMIVYDRVIPNNATDTLIALLIGVSIIFVSDFVIRTVRGYFLDLASAKADAAIADALFEQILDAQLHTRRGSSGALASIMKEFESIRDFLTSATLTTFIDIPFSILFLVVIWLIGGPMAYVPLIAIPVMLLAGLLVEPPLKKIMQESQQDGH